MCVLPCYINVARRGAPPAAVPAAVPKRASDKGSEARSTADSILVLVPSQATLLPGPEHCTAPSLNGYDPGQGWASVNRLKSPHANQIQRPS